MQTQIEEIQNEKKNILNENLNLNATVKTLRDKREIALEEIKKLNLKIDIFKNQSPINS
jgi:hypothetical protein